VTTRGKVGEFLRHTVVSDSGKILVINVAGAGLAFLSHLLFARWMSVESFGVYVYALSWLNVLTVLIQVGLNVAAVRFIAEYRAVGNFSAITRLVGFSTWTVVALGAAVAAAGAVLIQRSGGDGAEMRHTLFAMLSLTIVLGLFQQRMAILQGFEKVLQSQAFHEVARPTMLLGAVFAATFLTSLSSTVVMGLNLALTALLLVVIIAYSRRFLGTAAAPGSGSVEPQAGAWLRISLPYLVISGVGILLTQIDVLIIGTLLGPEQAGLYAPAAKVAMLIVFPAMAIRARTAPLVARLHAEGDPAPLQRSISVATAAALVTGLSAALVIVSMRHFILGLFGDAFLAGQAIVCILALGYVVFAASAAVETYLLMGPFERVNTAALIATLIVNVVLNFVLIPIYGIMGAAIATCASVVFRSVASCLIVFRRTGILPFTATLRT